MKLAQNMDIYFCLGWHVLRNRKFEEKGTSAACRDKTERQFFEQGVWKDLPRDSVGIGKLRERLSSIFFGQIKAELPILIQDIEGKISECRSTLAKLGPDRAAFAQQQLFLLKIS